MAGNHVVSFRDLDVWREAMEVVVVCYRLTTPFPKSETYGLASQIQRAAVSIVANIAEGHPRPTNVFRHHVRIALGSQAELETLLELAGRLGLAAAPEIAPLSTQLDRIGRMLHRLASSLERRSANAEIR
jgi:four helix bundle protein